MSEKETEIKLREIERYDDTPKEHNPRSQHNWNKLNRAWKNVRRDLYWRIDIDEDLAGVQLLERKYFHSVNTDNPNLALNVVYDAIQVLKKLKELHP